eukprot:m.39732 g.39732  ORF g.39732 m.39732 type:complete len:256 (+) comp12694_c0_seq2:912-1679(+)
MLQFPLWHIMCVAAAQFIKLATQREAQDKERQLQQRTQRQQARVNNVRLQQRQAITHATDGIHSSKTQVASQQRALSQEAIEFCTERQHDLEKDLHQKVTNLLREQSARKQRAAQEATKRAATQRIKAKRQSQQLSLRKTQQEWARAQSAHAQVRNCHQEREFVRTWNVLRTRQRTWHGYQQYPARATLLPMLIPKTSYTNPGVNTSQPDGEVAAQHTAQRYWPQLNHDAVRAHLQDRLRQTMRDVEDIVSSSHS